MQLQIRVVEGLLIVPPVNSYELLLLLLLLLLTRQVSFVPSCCISLLLRPRIVALSRLLALLGVRRVSEELGWAGICVYVRHVV